MRRHLPGPRHRRQDPSRRGFAVTAAGLLASACAIAGASILAVFTAGGSYALWSDSAPLKGGTIRAGSTGLTVEGHSEYTIPEDYWTGMLPGDLVSTQLHLENTGTVSGDLGATVVGSTGPLLVHLAEGECSGTIAGPPSATAALGPLGAGAETVVCLQVSLPVSAPAGTQGLEVGLLIDFALEAGS